MLIPLNLIKASSIAGGDPAAKDQELVGAAIFPEPLGGAAERDHAAGRRQFAGLHDLDVGRLLRCLRTPQAGVRRQLFRDCLGVALTSGLSPFPGRKGSMTITSPTDARLASSGRFLRGFRP